MTDAPPMIRPGSNLLRLTSLRAFAAGMVFLFHIGLHTQWIKAALPFDHGFVGVAFFFVLSGFVLTWSTRPGSAVRDFYIRRIARVYPSHAVMALVALTLPFTVYAATWLAAAANFLLVQSWFVSWPVVFGLNGVSWSLSCEAFFYLVAPFVIRWARQRSSRLAVAALGGWLLVVGAMSVVMGLHSQAADVAAYTLPILRSGEFGLGVLLALLFERGAVSRVPLWVPVLITVGLALALSGRLIPQSVANMIFVLPFGWLIFAAAATDRAGRTGLLTTRALTYAGEASFAFYLVHELTILGVRWAVGGGGTPLRGLLYAATAFAVAAVLSVVVHEFVEKPAQRWIRGRWLRPHGIRTSLATAD